MGEENMTKKTPNEDKKIKKTAHHLRHSSIKKLNSLRHLRCLTP